MATLLPPIDHPSSIRHRKFRRIKDLLARQMIGIGGLGVILAVTLIFVYLLYVVFPLFLPATVKVGSHYPLPGNSAQHTLHLATEEQAEIGVRFDDAGQATFFNIENGQVITDYRLDLPTAVSVTSFAAGTPNQRMIAYGLSDGTVVALKHEYDVSYPDNKRQIVPRISFPLGMEPIVIDEAGRSLVKIGIQKNSEQATIAAITDDGELLIALITQEMSFLDDEVETEITLSSVGMVPTTVTQMLLDKEQRTLYLADDSGTMYDYNISNPGEPVLRQKVSVVKQGDSITATAFLTSDISLLIGDSNGTISQWFPVRNENGDAVLTKIRDFRVGTAAVNTITPEFNRKGFIATDINGQFGIYHTTAERTVTQMKLSGNIQQLAISPRANAALVEGLDQSLQLLRIHNEHPEISWSSLWDKVWYESYDKPEYVWQSSSASNDFEPKFSLTPISFGTIKAAFYAMLFAVPLAIMGAIYTAYFMTPKLRSVVKPSIEIMEALPTVILGFLAGLWLAPMLEDYLPAVIALLLLLPLSVLITSYLWHCMPRHIRTRIPEGWQAVLLVPVIMGTTWLAFALNQPVENWLFGGDTRSWLTNELGIAFDQRNSLVVGIAMGFAVIPTIFSITEDAVFGVPRHLTNGSLALGATPWQTLTRVVILTASPGIFSAVMIGFGRAVGETMIVLMATGNTPVMDFSIFQGMRTLSANIAVEMPESEVDSTHYRVLFLAALVLFAFTFLFNTVAEVVRQRLRKKYSSL